MLTPLAPITSYIRSGNSQNELLGQANALQSNRSNGLAYKAVDNKYESFAIFNNVLQKAYERIASSTTGSVSNINSLNSNQPNAVVPEYSGFSRVDKISSQQAADTILGFISQRIKYDQANGANQGELLERLDQGLKGFIKGFNEAKNVIEGLGLLNPSLSNEIEDTYNRVTSGINDLRDSITGVDNNQDVSQVSRLNLAGEISNNEIFSLELTTQDGDRVVIDISRSSEFRFNSSIEGSANGVDSKLTVQGSSKNAFNLTISGELDEGELEAINQLLQNVDQIAGEFFKGNYDEAFNQALTLDIDKEELSSLSLQLQKTTSSSAIAAYQSAQNGLEQQNNQSQSAVPQLNELLDNIQNILQEARVFSEPLRLITDLSNGLSRLNNENIEQSQANELSNKLLSLVKQFGFDR